MTAPRGFWRSERALLGLVLLLQTAVTAWLILDRRLPRGHDTLGNYFLQYLFASHAAGGDGVALWMPYVAHGLVSNWALTIQGGLLPNALLALGGPPQGTNFLVLFHLGMYVEEVVLILGVWALGRRFALSPLALFFTAAAAAGSNLWADQIYWNHRALFALPLVLALLQGYLEEGRRWKLHVGLNLLILQVLGNVPYIAFLTGFVVLVYFAVYAAVWGRRIARSWDRLRPKAADLLLGLAHLGALAAVLATFTTGAGEIVQYRHARNPDLTVPIDSFLTYGGGTNPLRYLEAFLGTSPSMGYSLYAGAPVVALALLAFPLRPGRRVLHLGLALVIVFLFSLGALSLLPAAAYHALPPLRYFRYISLAAPFVRLTAVVLAGLGFDALVRRARVPAGPRRVAGALLLGAGIGAAGLAALVAGGALQPVELLSALKSSRFGTYPFWELEDRAAILPVLAGAALAAGAAGLLLLRHLASPRPEFATLVLLALLEAVDAYRWKVQMLALKTAPLDGAASAVQRIEPVPYAPRRREDYLASPRYRAMAPAFFDYGVTYDFTDGFLHLDPPSSRYWCHHWLRPVDLLARAYGTRLRGSEAAAEEALSREFRRLFPTSLPAYSKILGAFEDKLQVFSRAHAAAADAEIAERLNDPRFRGDVLLLSGSAPGALPALDPGRLSGNDRVPAEIRVLSFGANHLALEVKVPAAESGGWLVYSDAWHPSWRATVDGIPAPVERAFLAYKAVRLGGPAAVHHVEFRFESPARVVSYRLLGFNSLAWIVGILSFTFRTLRGRPELKRASGGG